MDHTNNGIVSSFRLAVLQSVCMFYSLVLISFASVIFLPGCTIFTEISHAVLHSLVTPLLELEWN